MGENTDLKLGSLRAEIREPVRLFAEKLRGRLGENLKTLTVVGSSLTEDFKPGVSDINTVVVLDRQEMMSLSAIAELARPMRKKRVSVPLLMTEDYIRRSLDVFGVELLDFQLVHRTVLGEDVFASLEIARRDVRLQCERELKAMLIRLRQGYISAGANKRLVRDVLIATAKGLMPLLRAMLWLKGIQRPTAASAVLEKGAEEFEIGLESVRAASRWRYEKVRLDAEQMQRGFEGLYQAVDRLAKTADGFEG